jgi:hypothetical protein
VVHVEWSGGAIRGGFEEVNRSAGLGVLLPIERINLSTRRPEHPRSFEDAFMLAPRFFSLGAGNGSVLKSEEDHHCRDRAKSRQRRSVIEPKQLEPKVWSTTTHDNHPKATKYCFTIHPYCHTLQMNRGTNS